MRNTQPGWYFGFMKAVAMRQLQKYSTCPSAPSQVGCTARDYNSGGISSDFGCLTSDGRGMTAQMPPFFTQKGSALFPAKDEP